jgi:hypothetical protein
MRFLLFLYEFPVDKKNIKITLIVILWDIFYHYICITLLLYKYYKPMEILRIFDENSKYPESECR